MAVNQVNCARRCICFQWFTVQINHMHPLFFLFLFSWWKEEDTPNMALVRRQWRLIKSTADLRHHHLLLPTSFTFLTSMMCCERRYYFVRPCCVAGLDWVTRRHCRESMNEEGRRWHEDEDDGLWRALLEAERLFWLIQRTWLPRPHGVCGGDMFRYEWNKSCFLARPAR